MEWKNKLSTIALRVPWSLLVSIILHALILNIYIGSAPKLHKKQLQPSKVSYVYAKLRIDSEKHQPKQVVRSKRKIKKIQKKKKKVSWKDLAPSEPTPNQTVKEEPSPQQVAQEEPMDINTLFNEHPEYFNRIKRTIERKWRPKIKRMWNKRTNQRFVTKVKVTMDANGAIKKVEVIQGSGLNWLDQKAVEAFLESNAFPNPPKSAIKNGKFILMWSFIIRETT